MIHTLKTWPKYFQAVVDNEKTFEIRSESDRTFEVNDVLHLQEYDPENKRYSGREASAKVSYLIRGPDWGLPLGLVVLGLVGVRSRSRVTCQHSGYCGEVI